MRVLAIRTVGCEFAGLRTGSKVCSGYCALQEHVGYLKKWSRRPRGVDLQASRTRARFEIAGAQVVGL